MDWLWEESACEVEIKDIAFTLPSYLDGYSTTYFYGEDKKMKQVWEVFEEYNFRLMLRMPIK